MGAGGTRKGWEAGPRVCEGLEGEEQRVCLRAQVLAASGWALTGDREAVPLTLQIIYSKVSVLLACPRVCSPCHLPRANLLCTGPSL